MLLCNVRKFQQKVATDPDSIRNWFRAHSHIEVEPENSLTAMTEVFAHQVPRRSCVVEYTWPGDKNLLRKIDDCATIALEQRRIRLEKSGQLP